MRNITSTSNYARNTPVEEDSGSLQVSSLENERKQAEGKITSDTKNHFSGIDRALNWTKHGILAIGLGTAFLTSACNLDGNENAAEESLMKTPIFGVPQILASKSVIIMQGFASEPTQMIIEVKDRNQQIIQGPIIREIEGEYLEKVNLEPELEYAALILTDSNGTSISLELNLEEQFDFDREP